MASGCQSFLAFILKFLIFLQTSIAVCMIMYSIFMLNHWDRHAPDSPALPPASASPSPSVEMMTEQFGIIFNKLPAPWFIYSFMGLGILTLCISCVGHIAAEAVNGCCLSFYSLLMAVFLLMEGVCVAFIALNHQWKEDLPYDSTGELHKFMSFIETNRDIFMWAGIVVLVIQAMSLQLAFSIRAMVPQDEEDYDCEQGRRQHTTLPGCSPGSFPNQKNLNRLIRGRNSSQLHSCASDKSRSYFSDLYSSRIRDKYGLNASGTKYVSLNQEVQ